MSPFRGSAAFTESWQNFDLSLDDGVATVTFTRPDKLNALTFDVYADLRDLLGELPHRGDARVLVITGARPRLLLGRRRRGDHRRAASAGRASCASSRA